MTEVGEGLAKIGIELFFDILDALIGLLPAAPFRAMLDSIESIDVLGYVNYFIPFDFCARCINAWLICVLAYYIYKYLKQAIESAKNKMNL